MQEGGKKGASERSVGDKAGMRSHRERKRFLQRGKMMPEAKREAYLVSNVIEAGNCFLDFRGKGGATRRSPLGNADLEHAQIGERRRVGQLLKKTR